MTDPHGQQEHAVRLEWGPTGGTAVAAGADVAVVVDVLSFTTTLTVAVERGMAVHPFAWKDERAGEHAADLGAVLAVGRFEEPAAGLPAVSLSAVAMSRVEGVDRIVLPSPNGSAICAALAGSGVAVVGACLRNRTAVAHWLAPRVADGAVVAVVPAGERWPDGSMRPGAEDLWGAGAVVDAMVRLGATGLSLEATHARDAFRAAQATLRDGLLACASGKELVAAGFAEDVEVAAGLDVSDVVPVLGEDGAFRAAR
ncbi:2-phosphosulfolactate phosphatase [Nocardioides sp. cx-173]|uniref:2-phosphosulfolactate phosphatase n=1 Tax=Nocardioides sp. cx-173 TaxID=2898796 RepID=UPI001E403104|nr:2-phosphosulfolactate phosphatase [Nocardioides sp. cx-173]MCD4523657.1 2-phosphosulfolactate phosphatase [Nocardioides sp. cx-173]UGB42011.1 2-phosphosulfolactate phosphatase [Nocardioides sp. cx-173]